jgi:hypothetical protein
MTSKFDLEVSNVESENNPQTDQENLSEKVSKKNIIIAIIIIIVVLTLIVLSTIFLLQSDKTSQIRDIFLIFMALESLIIGIALVILIVQLATLINLLQNEIRPIINSTSETVNTLKGTAQFLSDNLAEPVIKINSFAAKIKRLFKTSKK